MFLSKQRAVLSLIGLFLALGGLELSTDVVAQEQAAPVPEQLSSASAAEAQSISLATGSPVASEAESHKSSSRVIEEIVVTAQKREENLQDVPISVAAFSGEKLEALGVKDQTDLVRITPGLTYAVLTGYSLIYIRGVGTDAFIPSADTSVASYLDGIYLPFAHALAQSFLKLERIEVLKGPQGTLYGRNSTGGAINIITKSPSNVLEGSLDVGAGNFDARNVKAYVSGPILGSLSGSVSALYDHSETYYKFISSSPVQSARPDNTGGLSTKLQWDPFDDFSVTANGFFTRYKGTRSIINTPKDTKPLGRLVGVKDLGPYEASTNEDNYLKANNDLGYILAKWRPSLIDIKLSASHQFIKTFTNYDFDQGPENFAFFRPVNQFSRVSTAELQFSSKEGGLLSEWLEYTAGAYYYRSTAGFDPLQFGVLNLTSTAQGPLPTILGPLLTRLGQIFPVPVPDGVIIQGVGILGTKAYAGYGQAKWQPFDWFSLTVGGRYQTEDRGIVKSTSGLANTDGSVTQLFNFDSQHNHKATTNNFSPKGTIDFKFSDSFMIYASAQKGFKSGTFNIVNLYSPITYVKPETVIAYELGTKGYLFSRTLQFAAAIFDSKIHNLQTQIVSLQSGGAASLENAADATIYGAELDLTWQLLPVSVPGLVLTTSGSYLHGRYDKYPHGSGYDPTTGLFFGDNSLTGVPGRDFSGNKAIRTPEYSAALGLSYTFNVPGGSVELGGDGYYSSSYFYDTQNTALQPFYYLLNARASYLYEPWNVRLTAYGRNLNDRKYFLNQFVTDFGNNATYAEPRTYGATLSWQF